MPERPDPKEQLTPNPEHLAKLKEGVQAWNAWRDWQPATTPELQGAKLRGVNLERANLRLAILEGVDLEGANLGGADLLRANLAEANLEGADLGGARLEEADMANATLRRTRLYEANLKGATLTCADLNGAFLSQAQISGADLSWADLGGAHLGEADLTAANLEDADLSGATLERAHLAGANLMGATLQGADLTDACLREAYVGCAKLEEANLTRAVLEGTDFSHSSLRGTVFSHAKTHRTVFSETEWLAEDGSLPDPVLYTGLDIRGIRYSDPLFDQFVMQSEFIRRSKETWPKPAFSLWKLTCDCGRSVTRWLACCAAIIIAFAIVFGAAYHLGTPLVAVTRQAGATWLTHVYFSVVTFSTLGFGDVTPCNWLGEFLVMLEVLIGYAMLGGAISIFTAKFIPPR